MRHPPSLRDSQPAHPRSRGEHRRHLSAAHGDRGSSPLARGTFYGFPFPGGVLRLIPARAGNILAPIVAFLIQTAHPRSRGEHQAWYSGEAARAGSSPLARGTFRFFSEIALSVRLIPARAGNMGRGQRCQREGPAHPRSRGEHVQSVIKSVRQRGSSPLARGTCPVVSSESAENRLIPARAGNIRRARVPMVKRSAHPRSRGEHGPGVYVEDAQGGSSPLARGTYLLTWGFIPYISKIESL